MKPALSCSVVVASVLICASANANPFGYHEHDGFYARLSLGAASLDVLRRTDAGAVGSVAFAREASRIRSASLFTELSLGATPLRGFVVAATLLFYGIPGAQLRIATGSRVDLGTPFVFAMFGPSLDVFPNPSRGFHVGGGFGLATSTAGVEDPIFSTIGGLGVGGSIMFGQDFWISDDWSVGLVARGTFASIGGQDESAGAVARERDTITSASLAATLLYH